MYKNKSDHELEQGWVRTHRTHPLDTRLACEHNQQLRESAKKVKIRLSTR